MSGTASLPLVGPDEDLPADLFRSPPPLTPPVNCSGVLPSRLNYDIQCSGVLPYPVFVAHAGTQVELPDYGRNYGLGDPYYIGNTVVGRVMSRGDERGRVRLRLDRPVALNKNDVFGARVSTEFW